MSSSTTTKALVSTDWIAEHAKGQGSSRGRGRRRPVRYEKGHIEGAVGWNWRKDLQDQLNRDIATKEALANLLGQSGVTPDTTIVLYGDNNNWFAAYAYWALKYYGHDKVQLIDGGRVKWEKEGREYSTDVPQLPARPTTSSTVAERGHPRLPRLTCSRTIGKAGLVDVRSPKEYSGELLAPENLPQEGAQRGGHIPTAVSIPWATAVNRGRHLQERRRAARRSTAARASPRTKRSSPTAASASAPRTPGSC